MAYLTRSEVRRLGFASVGEDVTISDRCSIHGAEAVSLGNHVRIDDFAIITARQPVVIGSRVHISAFAFLAGTFGITVGDYTGVSIRATVLSGNDDYSGHWLPGPFVPPELRHVEGAPVHIGPLCLVGAHSVLLPGAHLGAGVAVGALSLVKTSLAPWGIYAGVPARRIGDRERRAEALAAELEGG